MRGKTEAGRLNEPAALLSSLADTSSWAATVVARKMLAGIFSQKFMKRRP